MALNPNDSSIDKALNSAVALHRAGRLEEAGKIYQHILTVDPENPGANHLLGIIALQENNSDRAIALISKAIAKDPSKAHYYLNLGNAFRHKDNHEKAIENFNKAITLHPGFAEAYNNLGNSLRETGQISEAVSSYNKALAINPNYKEALSNMGLALQMQGKVDTAIEYFSKALSIDPSLAEAHNNLGMALEKKERFGDAEAAFVKAAALKPMYADPYINLGNLLRIQNRSEEAASSYRKALTINPGLPETLNNLGTILQEQGKSSEAVECFQKAVTVKPDFAPSYYNLGNAYREQGFLEKAYRSYRQALHHKPDYFMAHSNLLFLLNYQPEVTDQQIYEESLKWEEQQAGNIEQEAFSDLDMTPDRKLKIGYVSPDFRTHSVAYFFEPLLKAHNREDYEIHCYSNVGHPDEVTRRLQAEADHWASIVGLEDKAVAEMIRADGIDILVDLAGHTGNNRLVIFAHKPAPIQVTWLGYPNTTGLKAIDYRLTDEIADPTGRSDAFYSEKLIRLEHGFLCYQPDESAPEVSPPPCSKEGVISFGSFNNLAKVNGGVIRLWAGILQAVPGSRMILKGSVGNQDIKKQFAEIFKENGIAEERVIFYDKVPKKEDHLALYSKVDIGLDPFPYNGTTTTCEALWMGVPVVTLLGSRHSGRVGASIMHRLGLEEPLVAETPDDYIAKAVRLAQETDQLAELRNSLRSFMLDSPLCDTKTFAAAVEDSYRKIWNDYLKSR